MKTKNNKSLAEQISNLVKTNENKINRPEYGMIVFSIRDGIVYRIDVSESIIVPDDNNNINGRARLPKVANTIVSRT